MKKYIIKEVLSAYDSWINELRQEGFTPDDFTLDETIDAIDEIVDHKKY